MRLDRLNQRVNGGERPTVGALYGTSTSGGTSGAGTVFKLAPPKPGQPVSWSETVLYSFLGGADGGSPVESVTADGRGLLFGTANSGGSGDNGVVFELKELGERAELVTTGEGVQL